MSHTAYQDVVMRLKSVYNKYGKDIAWGVFDEPFDLKVERKGCKASMTISSRRLSDRKYKTLCRRLSKRT